MTVHADHLNFIYNKLPRQQMTRWRLLFEEYNPKLLHIKGVDNNDVDDLSRLDITNKENDARVWGEKSKRLENVNVHMMDICMFLLEAEFEEDGFDDGDVITMAEVEDPSYPLDLKSTKEAQLNDE